MGSFFLSIKTSLYFVFPSCIDLGIPLQNASIWHPESNFQWKTLYCCYSNKRLKLAALGSASFLKGYLWAYIIGVEISLVWFFFHVCMCIRIIHAFLESVPDIQQLFICGWPCVTALLVSTGLLRFHLKGNKDLTAHLDCTLYYCVCWIAGKHILCYYFSLRI